MVCTRPVVGAAVATVVAVPGAGPAVPGPGPAAPAIDAATSAPSAPEPAHTAWAVGAVRLAAFRAANRAW